MRTAATTVFVGLLVGTLGYASGYASQSQGTVAIRAIVPVGYPDDYYAERPTDGMHWVYFVGERIEADLVFSGMGYAFRKLRSPSGIPAGIRWNDREQPLQPKVDLSFGTLMKRTRAGSGPVSLGPGDTVEIELGEELALRVEVPAASLNPGRHILHFETDLIDNEGQPVVPYSPQFMFEVRVPTQDNQLERTRRSAVRAHVAGDNRTARRDVTRMLELNATSVMAYLIQGDIESAEGHWAAAVDAYQTSLRLLDGGSDRSLPPRLHLRETILMQLERARLRVG